MALDHLKKAIGTANAAGRELYGGHYAEKKASANNGEALSKIGRSGRRNPQLFTKGAARIHNIRKAADGFSKASEAVKRNDRSKKVNNIKFYHRNERMGNFIDSVASRSRTDQGNARGHFPQVSRRPGEQLEKRATREYNKAMDNDTHNNNHARAKETMKRYSRI